MEIKHKILIVAIVICFSLIFTMAVLNIVPKENSDEEMERFSAQDFPLEVDLLNTIFNLGDKMSFNATITNKCGRDVTVTSTWYVPYIFFHEINDTDPIKALPSLGCDQFLKANDKLSNSFEYEFVEPGTYIFEVEYTMVVNGITISDKLDDIIVEIK
ncbi:hypothetical protein [Candidatus Bathycorpusculum sp.]|jgi:hypothetical protein|uniref:hypothetical protein n=1 Tax=Candidatus Bathycorpusculum sp. TaxID=2994959 RepID=UPI00282D2B6A|nr:hypothetical protein [Candidatus Termitimicrobium sp.]MCL2431853.1 hypothetical protein [Candidatus Termitimicrobium sp.]